jgi:hypothetical protein
MGTTKSRQTKIEWLKMTITSFFKERKGKNISKDKLLSEFALSQYSTRRTGEELLASLADTGFIKINGDDIIK